MASQLMSGSDVVAKENAATMCGVLFKYLAE